MEATVELEDDVFFADLSKQISMLIMDDDDDNPVATNPSVSLQTFSRANYQTTRMSPHLEVQISRRESKGTGVFIPSSLYLQPMRKNRQQRSTSFNTKSNRHKHNNSTKMTSQHSLARSSIHR